MVFDYLIRLFEQYKNGTDGKIRFYERKVAWNEGILNMSADEDVRNITKRKLDSAKERLTELVSES